MNITLITGVAGFIGSNLAERLLLNGDTVIGIDNFISGSKANIDRLSALKTEGHFEFHEFDVSDEKIIDFVMDKIPEGKLDQIYHLACPASPIDFEKFGVEILETCANGTMHILKIAEKTGARFLYTSTSEVYGDPLEHPQRESYLGNVNTLGPRSCYDEGKRFSESYIVHFCAKHNVDFRIARIFNTYGPYMRKDDGRVIPNFIEQIKHGKSLTIYGDGSQIRSFCYIDDMLDGLMKLMGHNFEQMAGTADERVFNLGNPNGNTILGLAKILIEITGATLNTIEMDLPKDDPKMRKPDIGKAESVLDFHPGIGLNDGLKKTLENW
ncbi:MAG: GDP-mannose 4,6-dehydratase [Candidatus Peregrinibacteria bacterium]|nr:GDP-mannose 4,6-dehydratase [Candidatus Peregrinibacteria bacterium]MDZ4245468.1 GDP-mannose 4,6-dehydratase [Candidatus Gracilibacteria bacterium]